MGVNSSVTNPVIHLHVLYMYMQVFFIAMCTVYNITFSLFRPASHSYPHTTPSISVPPASVSIPPLIPHASTSSSSLERAGT